MDNILQIQSELRAHWNAPSVVAIRTMLAENAEDEMRLALSATLSPEQRHHQAGRAAALMNFLDELNELAEPDDA